MVESVTRATFLVFCGITVREKSRLTACWKSAHNSFIMGVVRMYVRNKVDKRFLRMS